MTISERYKDLTQCPPRTPSEHAMAASAILTDFAAEQATRGGSGWMVTPIQISLAQAYATTALAMEKTG